MDKDIKLERENKIWQILFPIFSVISFLVLYDYKILEQINDISIIFFVEMFGIVLLEALSIYVLLVIFNIKDTKMYVLIFTLLNLFNPVVRENLLGFNYVFFISQILTIFGFYLIKNYKEIKKIIGFILIFISSLININCIVFILLLMLLAYFIESSKEENFTKENKTNVLINIFGIIGIIILSILAGKLFNNFLNFDNNSLKILKLFQFDDLKYFTLNLSMFSLSLISLIYFFIKNKSKEKADVKSLKIILALAILIGIVILTTFSNITSLFLYLLPIILLNEIEIKDKYKNIIFFVILLIFPFIYLNIMYNFLNLFTFSAAFNGIFYTIIVSMIIFISLFILTKNSSLSLKILYSMTSILLIINQIKLSVAGEPIFLSDAKFLLNILAFPELLSNTSNLIIIKNVCLILGLLLNLIILFKLVNEYQINIKDFKVKRYFGIIILAVFFIVLFTPLKITNEFCSKYLFNQDTYEDYHSYGTNKQYYAYYGFCKGLYGMYLNNFIFEPDDYNEEELNLQLNSIDIENTSTSLGKPNIIVVMSESFMDLNNISEDTSFSIAPNENFTKLKEQGKLINLISPTYGGMSENSVFELLTGGTCSYFNRNYIPIMSLYNRENAKNNPSLVKILNNSNYYTKTTFVKDFYMSQNAYTTIGFQSYRNIAEETDSYDEYNDEKMTDVIIEDLNEHKTNYFGVYSMYEGHMPYSKDKYSNYDIEVYNDNLNQLQLDALRSYAQGIYESDEQLGRLYDYIQTIEEPTIVLFLPDHLPFLYDVNYLNVLDKLAYFNTSDELLNTFRFYNTQGLVLSNFESDVLDNIPSYIGYNYLLTYIVDNMDVDKQDYYVWLENNQNTLAAFNRFISVDKQGNIYDSNQLDDNMKSIYSLEKLMIYKLFVEN